MRTTLFTILCLCIISCQESPNPALDDPTDDTVNLFETVPVNIPAQFSTLPVELDTAFNGDTVLIPDQLIQTTLWPLETETISFEPHNTIWDEVDTEENCSCSCHSRFHCHGEYYSHEHSDCQDDGPNYRCYDECHKHLHCHLLCK